MHGIYNLISVWFIKISKRFLADYDCEKLPRTDVQKKIAGISWCNVGPQLRAVLEPLEHHGTIESRSLMGALQSSPHYAPRGISVLGQQMSIFRIWWKGNGPYTVQSNSSCLEIDHLGETFRFHFNIPWKDTVPVRTYILRWVSNFRPSNFKLDKLARSSSAQVQFISPGNWPLWRNFGTVNVTLVSNALK